MSPDTDVAEPQERLYTLRDEIARKPARTKRKAGTRRRKEPAIDADLHRLESSIYPICEYCGERIEMEGLRASVTETCCGTCKARDGHN